MTVVVMKTMNGNGCCGGGDMIRTNIVMLMMLVKTTICLELTLKIGQ